MKSCHCHAAIGCGTSLRTCAAGALEALYAILQDVDGGVLTAPEAIEQLLSAQIQLRNNRRLQAAMRSSCLPAIKELPATSTSTQALPAIAPQGPWPRRSCRS